MMFTQIRLRERTKVCLAVRHAPASKRIDAFQTNGYFSCGSTDASKLETVFLCVRVCWIAAKMPLRSVQGLPQHDDTAAASVDLGQRLPHEIVAISGVHAADESFTGAVVNLLCRRVVLCCFCANCLSGLENGGV